ncbi:DUF6132 family protein [Mangrovibacterium diazotrophicum]|uniref:Uncharacterized protein n=1 Tax=Mangrovibacterium diazotrophicum TaxID=1261403 RepID=A0A419W8I2_9BACT|nr:DUF6132 family protein [Mangrovibacterium diazotrophicum]RKD91758.1 hypothetical protein BC643_2123 [Mangrovibacterium diazotrophicum]
MKLRKFTSKYKWQLFGTGIGIIAGFLYWYYIGCTSGTCPIQSNWHTSSLYGGLLGYFVSDLKKKPAAKEEDQDGAV